MRLVVFDCDETLTISTFLPNEQGLRSRLDWTSEWADYIATMNFESPYVEGSRVEKLRSMLQEITGAADNLPHKRVLAILTRNNGGAVSCMNLLKTAGLDIFFSAVWGMFPLNGIPAGIYRDGTEWKAFSPPFHGSPDNKADVLYDVAARPGLWFPQFDANSSSNLRGTLDGLRIEEIILVDDVRSNFQSGTREAPKKVLRCCKVARFDANYREMGFVKDMGGIGARDIQDYHTLIEFVKVPWLFRGGCSIQAVERPFEGSEYQPPVKLVLFDFDETLSLYTFMPSEPRCSTEIGYFGANEKSRSYYVQYNFETPYLEGDRVEKLRNLLSDLIDEDGDSQRVLAVLTRNELGAVAVLNLLLMAGLAEFFSAIWTLSAQQGKTGGVYRDGKEWRTMPLPKRMADANYKIHVLQSIVSEPGSWFPQLAHSAGEVRDDLVCEALSGLRLPNIVLVDDERESCQESSDSELQVLRFCKVASYDDEYRDQGLLVHMGGIGAKTDEDYITLRAFVRRPWKFAEAEEACCGRLCQDDDEPPVRLVRSMTEQELNRKVSKISSIPSSASFC